LKAALYILFQTKKGLEILENEYEDVLYRKGILIYGIYGFVDYLFKKGIPNQSISYGYFFGLFVGIMLSIIFGLLGGQILHFIGKLLKGKANSVEIFSLLSYANIPIIIAFILVGILRGNSFVDLSFNNDDTRNIIMYVSWIIYLKILIIGLIKYNKYSFLKSLINLSLVPAIIAVLYFVNR